jgi:hypothetical protein
LRLALLLIALIAVGYFGFTRYRYGSSHPCGILKAKMMPYRVAAERKAAMAVEHKHSQRGEATRFEDPEIRQAIRQDWQRIRAAPEIASAKLDDELARLTLVQCISQVLTWHPPQAPAGN